MPICSPVKPFPKRNKERLTIAFGNSRYCLYTASSVPYIPQFGTKSLERGIYSRIWLWIKQEDPEPAVVLHLFHLLGCTVYPTIWRWTMGCEQVSQQFARSFTPHASLISFALFCCLLNQFVSNFLVDLIVFVGKTVLDLLCCWGTFGERCMFSRSPSSEFRRFVA